MKITGLVGDTTTEEEEGGGEVRGEKVLRDLGSPGSYPQIQKLQSHLMRASPPALHHLQRSSAPVHSGLNGGIKALRYRLTDADYEPVQSKCPEPVDVILAGQVGFV